MFHFLSFEIRKKVNGYGPPVDASNSIIKTLNDHIESGSNFMIFFHYFAS